MKYDPICVYCCVSDDLTVAEVFYSQCTLCQDRVPAKEEFIFLFFVPLLLTFIPMWKCFLLLCDFICASTSVYSCVYITFPVEYRA